MKVSELIAELSRWPADAEVHIDVTADELIGEGERVVRTVAGVRHQSGFYAVAIDGNSADESNGNYGVETDTKLVAN